MKKLTPNQLNILERHLILNGSNDALKTELLDHISCEVESYMQTGIPFESSFEKVLPDVNAKAIKYLRENYQYTTAMTEKQLAEASLDDIVFEFRNKAYGAYDLRRSYPNALKKAFFLGIGIFCMIFAIAGGLAARAWSFTSPMMVLWTIGLSCVAYSIGSWYFEKHPNEWIQPLS